mmetsp:Transcript_112382/g.305068  ORF Transcript_112382/g.305068 Transcript_112382/m.305068 type:complete len:245 (+) Transcript_112382:570-1304(+)
MVPPISDQRPVCQCPILLVLDLVPQRNASIEFVLLRARLRRALRKGEGQAARRFVPVIVQRLCDACAVLGAWEPRHQDRVHALVPGARYHRARSVHDDDHWRVHLGVLLDQLHVLLLQLQRAPVASLLRLLGDHHDDHDVRRSRIAPIVQAGRRRRAADVADAGLDADVGLLAGHAVPAAAAADGQGARAAGLGSDQGHLALLGDGQHAALVLEDHGRLGDDPVGELQPARLLVVVRALERAHA